MTTSTDQSIILLQSEQGMPITLPPLFCPFSSALNDQVEHVHAHTLTWAVAAQLVQPHSKQLARLHKARLAWVAARLNPDFCFDQLALFTDWLTWSTCYDDLCDANDLGRDPVAWGALIQRFMGIVQGGYHPAPSDLLASALAELCQRLRRQTSARWLERFAHDLKQTFQANRWEATVRANQATPDLATYTKMRQLTSAFAPYLDLMAICVGLDPQASWLNHAYLKQLQILACNHICWVNDLFGLAKEIQENNQHNLVLILQQEYQLPLQAAVDRAVALCNAEMKAFVGLADLFAAEEEGKLGECQHYIQRLQTWLRGNLDWYTETERYQVRPLAGAQLAG